MNCILVSHCIPILASSPHQMDSNGLYKYQQSPTFSTPSIISTIFPGNFFLNFLHSASTGAFASNGCTHPIVNVSCWPPTMAEAVRFKRPTALPMALSTLAKEGRVSQGVARWVMMVNVSKYAQCMEYVPTFIPKMIQICRYKHTIYVAHTGIQWSVQPNSGRKNKTCQGLLIPIAWMSLLWGLLSFISSHQPKSENQHIV